MTLVSPGELIASRPSGGVAAFNVIMLEHLEAFAAAAEERGTGVILQLSQNAVRYHGSFGPIGSAIVRRAEQSCVPFAVQLDHANDVALVREASLCGFTSIMFDGSKLNYADNVEMTRAVTSELQGHGIWVEAELGEVGGKDGVHSSSVRTDPGEAADFVGATGVDGLAVAVGSSHAMRDRSGLVDVELIEKLHAALPVPIVLHGSSGIDDRLIVEAVRAGISKVNFGTRFNAVLTQAVRTRLDAEPSTIDPRIYMAEARESIRVFAGELIGLVSALPTTDR